MPVIESLVAGKAFSVAFDSAVGAFKAFLSQDTTGRLLVLLHADFGEETELGRDVFYAWRAPGPLADALAAVLAGSLGNDQSELDRVTGLIEPRLVRTPEQERPELARRIAVSMVAAAPYAVGGEATQLLANRTAAGFQRVNEALADPTVGEPGSLAMALIVGPLRHADVIDDVQSAEKRASDGDLISAASGLLDIVGRLDERGLKIAAETLRARAADLLLLGGEKESARELLVSLVDSHLERGSRWGAEAVLKAMGPLFAEDPWLEEALRARIAWPELGAHASEALRRATDATVGRGDHLYWLEHYTSLLLLLGDSDGVLTATEHAPPSALEAGARLQLELNRLEALGATGREQEAESGWLEVLRFVDRNDDLRERGLVWQRRGHVLAREEKVAAADDAYRRAIDAFAALPGFEEQAGDAFRSMQASYRANGRTDVPDEDLRPLAWSLRGSADTPVARADRLVSEAMSSRLKDKLPEAVYGLWLAHLLQRRAGSLAGLLDVAPVLAELHEHAGRVAQAMVLYVAAGNGEGAARAAARASHPGELVAQLSLDAPRWERAVVYHLISAHGETLPPEYVAGNADRILHEARGEPDGFFAPQPVIAARKALASVAFGLPNHMRDEVFEQLRRHVSQNPYDVLRASVGALIGATNVAWNDATELLLETFLADPYNMGITPGWIAGRAAISVPVREALEREARAGHRGALEALASGELIRAEDATLRSRCGEIVDAAAVNGVHEERDGDTVTTTVGMGSGAAQIGILARSVPDESRHGLVARLFSVISDAREPEMNRASAVDAVFNLAGLLDASETAQAVELIEPLAGGDYELSQFDAGIGDPLTRFRLRFNIPNVLRTSALGALAKLVAEQSSLGDNSLRRAIFAALADPSPEVIAAAFEAASLVPALELPYPSEQALAHPDERVALGAFNAWAARNQTLPTGELLDRVLAHPSTHVRLELVQMAANSRDGAEVLAAVAESDASAYLRALAAHLAQTGGNAEAR